jgi:hypothetical protein
MTPLGFGRRRGRSSPPVMTVRREPPSTANEWEVVKLEESARWDRWPLLRAVP